ncbi:hypothetical protein MTR67_007960 [Solanum verrucosum]|uniref:ATP-dependent DNA helicase n=2 Tax=Solanum TaxID=4107 RepID=A0AAF0TIR4_SOLVR|nr:hypothetical protein MTR67_007960 [Solanum verrucosum]
MSCNQPNKLSRTKEQTLKDPPSVNIQENASNQIRTSTCSSNKAKQLFPPFYAFEKGSTSNTCKAQQNVIPEVIYISGSISNACSEQQNLTPKVATKKVYCNPSNPKELWEMFEDSLSEDLKSFSNTEPKKVRYKVLNHINDVLHSMGHDINEYNLVLENIRPSETTKDTKDIHFERNIIVSEEDLLLPKKLNAEQLISYNTIIDRISSKKAGAFFVDGPGGTGKTYLYRALLATVRSQGFIALATATSGVAASVLPGGRTAHSRFKMPIDIDDNFCCNTKDEPEAFLKTLNLHNDSISSTVRRPIVQETRILDRPSSKTLLQLKQLKLKRRQARGTFVLSTLQSYCTAKAIEERGYIFHLRNLTTPPHIVIQNFAFELLLSQHPDQRGKLVLVQIANPARGRGKDVQEVHAETYATVKRINQKFGRTGYEPVILVDKPLQFYERIAFYAVAECCLVTAVRDGMNLIPYEYVICRQGMEKLDATLGLNPTASKKSMLVVSVFIGCSPSLNGAIRVNPWNIDAVSVAMDSALIVSEAEKQMRHEKHYKYVCTHDVAYWAQSFLQHLERACRDHVRRRCWGIGFGLGFRVVALDPSFGKLSVEHIVSAYKRTKHRAILLDYDGTMTVRNSISKGPNAEVISILNSLCRDPKNIVFIVSGKDTKTLSQWFSSCETLGLAIYTADNSRRN